MDIPPAAVPAPSRSACEMENLPEEFLTLWKKEESEEDEQNREEDNPEFFQKMEKRWKQLKERSERVMEEDRDQEEDHDQEQVRDDEFLLFEDLIAEQEEVRERAIAEQNEIREQERRVGWKPSEMDLFMDISVLLTEKKMAELEDLYANKLELMEVGQGAVDPNLMPPICKQDGVDWKLMAYFQKYYPRHFFTRLEWSKTYTNLVFEDITNILP